MIDAVERVQPRKIIPVDEWQPQPEDEIFTQTKGAIIAPINRMFGMEDDSLINVFSMAPKKSYNSNTRINKKNGELTIGFKEHNNLYLNYFEKFYDTNHNALATMGKIKYLIDLYDTRYTKQEFMNDLLKYIIWPDSNQILHYDLHRMNNDNYVKMTSKYKNPYNPCLEYSDRHAKVLMYVSLIQNIMIPLLSHWLFKNKCSNVEIKEILLEAFDLIFKMVKQKYGIAIIDKIYETTSTSVLKSANRDDPKLWKKQNIRGSNPTTHSISTIENIILQIIPKYVYTKSIVCFNYNVINADIRNKVIDIGYEYELISISSVDKDEDNNSQADKFEANMSKKDESRAMMIKVNCNKVMENIERLYGPFLESDINFYMKRLQKAPDDFHIKNEFQNQLINYLFMSEFGDIDSLKYVNNRQYVILLLSAKRKLQNNGLVLLSDVISSKVVKIVSKKTLNAKIKLRMKMSDNYSLALSKYRNEEILDETLFGFIAKTLASTFYRIEPDDPTLDNTQIKAIPELVCEEFVKFTLLISK